MHNIVEIPAWERLLKRIVWEQLGEIKGKRILDFGSGEGITANHYAKDNMVVAVEPSKEMLGNRWTDYNYEQVIGDIAASKFGAIRYYEDEMISKWCKGLKLLNSFGIRTFWDLQQNQEKHGTEEWQTKMMQLEMRVSQIDEYKNIAFFHHLLYIKD